MRRTSLITIIVAALTLIGLVCASSQTRPIAQTPQTAVTPAQRQQLALERTVTTQQRLNRYFHNEIMPKLKNCWSRVQGRGRIEIEHTYTKDASGKWVVGKLAVSSSTLPRGQDAVGLQCMQDSVRGTSFRAEASDGSAKTYVVNWTWPVPFPANAAQLTNAMFAARADNGGTGSGGCDGEGTAAKCYNCSADGRSCQAVCVGYQRCAVSIISCGAHGNCASGGPFGLAGGGVTIY